MAAGEAGDGHGHGRRMLVSEVRDVFGRRTGTGAQAGVPSVTRRLQLEVEAMAASVEDAQWRNALGEFARDLRFSDPVSAPQLARIEERLEDCVQLLRDTLEDGAQDKLLPRLEKAKRVLNERNQLCRAAKR